MEISENFTEDARDIDAHHTHSLGPKSVIVGVILSLFILVTITGQLLVILAVVTEKNLRLPSNYWIASLALTDLILAVVVMPVAMLTEIKSGMWLIGGKFCDVFLFFDVLCCTASIFNLCLISVDRYFSITSPIKYSLRRTPSRALMMISCCWVTCILISIVRPMGWKTTSSDLHFCGLLNEGYRIFSSVFSFYLPLVVMLFVYYKIFVAARSRLQKIRDVGGGTVVTMSDADFRQSGVATDVSVVRPTELRGGQSSSVSNVSNVYAWRETADGRAEAMRRKSFHETGTTYGSSNAHQSNMLTVPPRNVWGHGVRQPSGSNRNQGFRAEKFSLAKERKAARTLGVVMGAFIFCWSPFFLFNVIVPYCDGCTVPMELFSFVTWLGYANSMLNPFIYTYFNKDFRRAFKRLLFIRHCGKCHR
ncbi:5-hydroxytryptamine receptor 1A-like [Ptychodera flava]|uniref:5-hydroxytryptamine receptor 1A-like n=1 Tax=Ptychodera flava TaxID=63121 RepID=UPI00396A35F4